MIDSFKTEVLISRRVRVLLPPFKFLISSCSDDRLFRYQDNHILFSSYTVQTADCPETPLFLTLWLNCVSRSSSQVACGTATKVGITK